MGGPTRTAADFTNPSPNTDNVARGDFGLIGLAVMGQNLILNAADHGFNVVAFNRTVSKVDHFLANEAKGESPNELSRLQDGMLIMVMHRQVHPRRPLHRGVRQQTEETPPHDAPCHGRQAS